MPLPPGFFDDATEQARTEQVVETRRPAQSEDRDDAELRLADSTPSQTRDEEVTSKQASTEQETESNMTNEMKEFLAFAATVPDDALEAEAPAAAGQTTSPPTVHRGSAKAAVSINENRVVEEESRALNSGDEQQGPQSEETNVIQQSHNTEGEEGVEEEEEEEEEEDIALLRMIRVAQRAARTEGKRQPPSRGANPMLESILSAKKARLEIEEEQGGLLESTPWD